MSSLECKADCFQDTCHTSCIRPISNPGKLVWKWFYVAGKLAGSMQARQFNPCVCGCSRLMATPSADQDTGVGYE